MFDWLSRWVAVVRCWALREEGRKEGREGGVVKLEGIRFDSDFDFDFDSW
jgi:hypothetical protein